jgi:hypothetical protein
MPCESQQLSVPAIQIPFEKHEDVGISHISLLSNGSSISENGDSNQIHSFFTMAGLVFARCLVAGKESDVGSSDAQCCCLTSYVISIVPRAPASSFFVSTAYFKGLAYSLYVLQISLNKSYGFVNLS